VEGHGGGGGVRGEGKSSFQFSVFIFALKFTKIERQKSIFYVRLIYLMCLVCLMCSVCGIGIFISAMSFQRPPKNISDGKKPLQY